MYERGMVVGGGGDVHVRSCTKVETEEERGEGLVVIRMEGSACKPVL